MPSSRDAAAGAVIVAAGAGRRIGGPVRKQYLEVDGVPLLLRAVRAFLLHPEIGATVVVLPPEDAESPPRWLREQAVRVVAGGAERGDSVRRGVAALCPDADPVLIHDGARPFVSAETITRVVGAARSGGAIAAVRATDTLKQVDASGCILRTLPREAVWHAQTPQGFPRGALLRILERSAADGVRCTDEAGLFERYGEPVRIVEASPDNLKVTRPLDLDLADVLARRSALRTDA